MATVIDKKLVPFIPSSAKGPLGVAHLPRLWTKLTLGSAGKLADGWDFCGPGFDEMTINDLGLNKDEVISYVQTQKPTYVQFEEWVAARGKTDAETVRKHNEAVHGYNHGPDTVSRIQEQTGLKNDQVKDAVTLNMLEDLHEMHGQITGK